MKETEEFRGKFPAVESEQITSKALKRFDKLKVGIC